MINREIHVCILYIISLIDSKVLIILYLNKIHDHPLVIFANSNKKRNNIIISKLLGIPVI